METRPHEASPARGSSPFPNLFPLLLEAGFTSVFTLVSVLSSSQGPTGCIPPFVKILRSTEMMGNEMVKP